MEYKVFNDLVHGHMEFHPLVATVVDTPQVQRLRDVRQLGVCFFVYPSATHTRFEHSLGTAYIAGKLFDSLKEKRKPSNVADDVLWEKLKLCAQIAGLCHDVGHGPFSHTWEKFLERCGCNWKHENESIRIFDEILKEKVSETKRFNANVHFKCVRDVFHHFDLNHRYIDDIKKMIRGDKETRNYLFQVINNKNNHIDVDKWEYLTRDSVMLNIPIAFDYKRLLKYCRVLKNESGGEEICFREKEVPILMEMFLARGKLHDVAYQHTKVKIIEEMVLDAFLLADKRLNLRAIPITNLTDHIFQKILYEDFGKDPNMERAKEILARILRRNLYQCIYQMTYEGDLQTNVFNLKNCLRNVEGIERYINEMKTTTVSVHMTKANRNKPLKDVMVYEKVFHNSSGHSMTKSKNFDWDNYKDCLKPDVGNLKRKQILLLYTGEEKFPEDLKKEVKKEFVKFFEFSAFESVPKL